MAYLTTVTIPNYVAPDTSVIIEVNAWCNRQQEMGNYTGQLEYGFLPDGTTWQIKRWDWVDVERCEAYFATMEQYFTAPDMVTEISEH